jgi:hypothetical protein
MDMFDKRFVHFIWDDKLEGKRCFVAGNIALLIFRVNSDDEAHRAVVTRNADETLAGEFPFRAAGVSGIGSDFRFAYYDPRYDARLALLTKRGVKK